jgi:hypothetical protein
VKSERSAGPGAKRVEEVISDAVGAVAAAEPVLKLPLVQARAADERELIPTYLSATKRFTPMGETSPATGLDASVLARN